MGNTNSRKEIQKLEKLDPKSIKDVFRDQHVIARITEVYDGDTCTMVFYIDKTPIVLKLRLMGIDTAEMKDKKKNPRTLEEIELANAAKKYLSDRVLNKCVYVKLYHWGKWGGRIIGDIFCIDKKGNITGNSLSKQLLESRLAVSYDGKKKSADWQALHREWKMIG